MSRFTITLSGLAEADAARFRAALEDQPTSSWRLVDGQVAYLMVVDIDTVWGHMDWLRATASDQRVVVYTERNEVRDGEWLLTKPLQPQALKALLNEVAAHDAPHATSTASAATAPAPAAAPPLHTRLQPKPEPAAVPVATAPPEAVAEPVAATAIPAESGADRAARPRAPEPVTAAAEPAAMAVSAPVAEPAPAAVVEPAPPPLPTTLGEQLLAGQIDHPLRVEGSDGIVLQLDPEHGGYYGPLTLKSLQPLLSLPADAAQPLDEVALAKARLAPALPLTRLLWFAALCASPGQLGATLDPQAPYRLTRWPQIEREFPRHFRIATTMMKQAGTLEQVAAAANAPVGDVADFINAYCMAGYVAAEMPADTVAETGPGMLSRLRRPFARSSQES